MYDKKTPPKKYADVSLRSLNINLESNPEEGENAFVSSSVVNNPHGNANLKL